MKSIDASAPDVKAITSSVEVDPITGRPSIPGGIVFFCAILAIFQPIAAIWSSFGAWATWSQHIEHNPTLMLPITASILITLFLACFGIYVANALWKMRDKSIGVAKAYLFTAIVASITSPAILLLFDFSPGQQTAIMTSGVIGFAWSFILNGTWLVYLSKSSRVSEAYGLK